MIFFNDPSTNWVASEQHPQTRERQEIQSHGQDLAAGREAAITIKEQEHLNGNFL